MKVSGLLQNDIVVRVGKIEGASAPSENLFPLPFEGKGVRGIG